jgi:GT2 family glycosyltransferase
MSGYSPSDLAVVIPTRDRWRILARTLDALASQTVSGFEVIVVVDGEDQAVPDLGHVDVIRQHKAGPGAARNRGVQRTARPLVLFLGDDIVPARPLIERHLAVHNREPEVSVAVLGQTVWHPEVAASPHNMWLEWSASQFDFAGIVGNDAGWGRFYSSNVSLKRKLFLQAEGFDEAFTFDYEDLDFAWRLHESGLRLRYEPEALGRHVHRYDWQALVRRYHSRGQAERQMAEKHPWFEPWFAKRLNGALDCPPVSAIWPLLAAKDRVHHPSWRSRIREKANVWYHQQLAAPFFGGWQGEDDLADLREYLGPAFDPGSLARHRDLVDEEEMDSPDEATFYRTSRTYLYDLTMFAVWGTKVPYLAALRRLMPPPARILDYGCGIGSDGLRLLNAGYQVSFADFDNPSTAYLRWRLARRGSDAAVYDIDGEVPGGFDAVFSFDVIEHVDDAFAFLHELERRGDLVIVNFLEPDPADTHLHRPLPVRRLLDHATIKGMVFYHCYEGRSHLVAYRSTERRSLRSVARSLNLRAVGAAELAAERLARRTGTLN